MEQANTNFIVMKQVVDVAREHDACRAKIHEIAKMPMRYYYESNDKIH